MSEKPGDVEQGYDSSLESIYNNLRAAFVEETDCLIGKLLTLADATMTDERQLKAFKDMVKSIVRDAMKGHITSLRMRLYALKKRGVVIFLGCEEAQVESEIEKQQPY